MNAKDLKNSILQLAVQGKLVEQRPEEGSAKELLAQIKAEKEQLIKDKKIKKEKPLPEITDEEIPFDIPESWEWVRLIDVVNFKMGKTPPRGDETYWGNECRWVSISDMIDGETIFTTKESVSKKAIDEKFKEIVPKGTMLMSFKLTVGKVSILGIDAVHNEAIISIYPYVDFDYAVRNYLFKILPYMSVFGKTKKAIMGFTLNSDSLSKLLIPIPPIVEQKRIVAKIEEILPYIEKYDKAYTKLEAFNKKFPEDMKKSILQMAMQGKLVEQRPEEGTADELYEQIVAEKVRLIKEGKIKKEKPLPEISEEEIPFEIPESWKWVRIGNIFVTSSGTTPLKSNSEFYSKADYNWVRTTDLNNGKLDACEIMISQKAFEECRLSILPRDSVCIAMYGGAGTIGKNAIIKFDTTINQSVCAIHPNGFCDMLFLQRFIQYYRPNWMKMAVGSRKDPNINQVIIKNALFPLPPLAEQKRIVAKLEQMLPYCEQLIK